MKKTLKKIFSLSLTIILFLLSVIVAFSADKNVFDFEECSAGVTANSASVLNVTSTGFTLLSDVDAIEGIALLPDFSVIPGESYKINMDIIGEEWDVYIFFLDSDNSILNLSDIENYVFSYHGYGVTSRIFVAPAGSVKARIRCDANGSNNSVIFDNISVYEGIYNMGEETYSFCNYVDRDFQNGHCFGMAVTSSAYYLGLLEPTDVGANSCREIYNISDNETVRKPICYYHAFQGSIRNNAFVAGGYGIDIDWNEIINYVKDHTHDNAGELVLGYGIKGQGGHAVNFLRYEVVDGQERIYVYDNNCPHTEAYFYKDNDNKVHYQAQSCQKNCGMITGVIDDHMALVSVSKYISNINKIKYYNNFVVYANASVNVENSTRYLMYGDIGQGEHYVYEIDEGVTTVKITPLVDNATFTYLGQDYTFGEIDDDTYAELTLATIDETVPEVEIFNEPVDEPAEPEVPENTEKACSCNCHGNAFMQFLHKIVSFLRKIFGMIQYQYCDCGKAHW